MNKTLSAFGLPKSIWVLNIGTTLNVIASSFLWPLNVIYMRQELGKSLVTAGFVMMIMAGFTAVGNMFGGILFDRIGGFRSIFTGILITFFALIGLNINHGWPYYPIFLICIGFGQGIVFPAMFAMIGTTWPEGGRKAYNVGYIMQNVGVAVGTALGGIVADYSYNYSFMGFLLFYIVFLLLTVFFIRKIPSVKATHSKEIKKSSTNASIKKVFSLVLLCIAYFICMIGYAQWQGVIPDHITKIGLSLRQYGLLWTLNGALIVVLQPFTTVFISKLKLKIKPQIIIGMCIFIVSFWITTQAETFWMFMFAMGVLTIGEMLIWPAIPTIVNSIAPRHQAGLFQGIANTSATIGRMAGPLIGASIVTTHNIEILFFALMGMMIFAIVFAYLHDLTLKRGVTVEKAEAL